MAQEHDKTSLTEDTDKARAAHTFDSRTVDSDIGTTEGWAEFRARVAEDMHQAKMVGVHHAQTFWDRMMDMSMNHMAQLNAAHARAVENAADSANLVNKQAVAHRDLAIDRIWNINETDAEAVVLATRVAENTKPAAK